MSFKQEDQKVEISRKLSLLEFYKVGTPYSCTDTLKRPQVQKTTHDTAYTTAMKSGERVKEYNATDYEVRNVIKNDTRNKESSKKE